MPDYKVEILTPAWEDIDRIADYHLKMVGPVSAERITDKLLDAIQGLADFPQKGQEHPDEVLSGLWYRKLICENGYVSVYKVIGETVFVYRVVHGATDYPRLLK